MSGLFKAAAIQMVSGPSVQENLSMAASLIADAVAQGANVVALPEYFCLMGMTESDKVAVREAPGEGPIQDFLAETAAKHAIWLLGGTIPLACPDADRVRNSLLVYDDQGQCVARYDKIHLFGFDNGVEVYRESNTIEAGDKPVAVHSPYGRIGLSICYDLRFPELYRSLLPVEMIVVPSAFTATTGQAHWDTLVRARAVENLAYVIAPAQGGVHANGRRTHGHSMIVDPWGRILGELPEGEGVVVAEIDPTYQARVRTSLPALEHRVI
ncbi:MAG TPA: carbon-nitrogen hydrolase family protein [Burkholderiales bacterium]|nr:carbon-nitrogen hydrolase family protein [Burkholderiales bacterium]